jgi:diguanylate cyclase (GGDEF)-like protein/PAS domain S-box-containing protein
MKKKPSEVISVLLIEDQPVEVELINEMLSQVDWVDYKIEHYDRLGAGLARAKEGGHDVLLLDLCLPDSAGIETVERARAEVPGIPTILMTNMDDEALAVRAVREGAQDYLIKRRVDANLLSRAIHYAIERHRADEALRKSEERYALAVRGSNDGVWDWDIHNDTVYYSHRWREILGLSSKEVGTDIKSWFDRVHKDDWEDFIQALQSHMDGETDQFNHEYRIAHSNGEYVWVMSRGLAVRDLQGRLQRMAGSLSDITARKQAEEQLIHDALHDGLTGLPNRTLMLDRIEQALKQIRGRTPATFAVLFLDLDRFKNVNDSLGHGIGDQLLKGMALSLLKMVRPGDTVARLGGDEFAILLSDVENEKQVTDIAERILAASQRKFAIDGHEVFTTVSIGIAIGRDEYHSAGDVLRDADIAMYRAKTSGKDCYELFDREMHERVVEMQRLETDLRRAVTHQEFVMHYQPIISLGSGELVGFEGLIRWQHPDHGLILPGRFIPAAEESGLIVPMSWWSIRESCQQMREWQQQFKSMSRLRISVNVSGRLFNQTDIVGGLRQILAETSLPPSSLCIEITESVVLDDVDDAMNKLVSLRELGVGLHVDDFGTGYSSLSYLQKFSYDSLKIDRTFVGGIAREQESGALVQGIISMGELLGMNVIAEGVETVGQLERLREMRCPEVQGYLFSKPVTPYEAARLLAVPPVWEHARIA